MNLNSSVGQWWNARVLLVTGRYLQRRYHRIKQGLLEEIPPRLVELGAGVGANFRYYPPGTRVLAVEPNPYTHRQLELEAARRGLTLDVVPTGAERLPLRSGSVDLVVATLLLCSVCDPSAIVGEVVRVLRRGGRFLAIEHVAAAPGCLNRRLQQLLAPTWRTIFGGCDLCRDPTRVLAAAGFAHISIDRLSLPGFVRPLQAQIVARCTR